MPVFKSHASTQFDIKVRKQCLESINKTNTEPDQIQSPKPFQNSCSISFAGIFSYSKTMKALGHRPRAFSCFLVFEGPDETPAVVLGILLKAPTIYANRPASSDKNGKRPKAFWFVATVLTYVFFFIYLQGCVKFLT